MPLSGPLILTHPAIIGEQHTQQPPALVHEDDEEEDATNGGDEEDADRERHPCQCTNKPISCGKTKHPLWMHQCYII